jgi:hypothetical chaperone protein
MAIDRIGIDFGTTNTCVAVSENGKVRVLPLDESASNPNLIRTLIYLPSRQESFFGKNAIDQYFDRGMEGRFFQSIKKLLPNAEFTGTSVFGAHLGVEALVARFLRELKKRIEKEIGAIEGIPIHMGRPARYSLEAPKEALAVTRFLKAIELAGLKQVRLIDEPTAAAASTSPIQKNPGAKLVLVCDLGGGTSDFTLFRRNQSSAGAKVEALSVYGVPVAGDSLDSDFFRERLNIHFGSKIQYQRPFSSNTLTLPTSFVKILPKWHHHAFLRERSTWNFILALRHELVDPKQKPLLENLITLVEENLGYKLHQEVERVKMKLSAQAQENFWFESYPIQIQFGVGDQEYENLIEPSVEEIKMAALETLRLANQAPSAVEILQFTGGTAQVPKIRRELAALFPRAELVDSEAFTAVAEGLATL